MKAIVIEEYGSPDILQLAEIKKPIPQDGELLIRIESTTVITGDCNLRRFDVPKWIWLPLRIYMGIFNPKINVLGQEFSGTIEATSKSVKNFKPGDKILGPTTMKFGAYAEYLCISANKPIAHNPINWSFQESATLSVGGLNALHLIRKASPKEGDHVLIIGAGGSIGSYAIQLAKEMGAYISAIDTVEKLKCIKKMGADELIDYKDPDFELNPNKYDAIIDLVGTYQKKMVLSSVKPGGHFIQGNPSINTILSTWYQSKKYKIVIKNTAAAYKREDLEYLRELAEKSRLTPFIDRNYTLEEMKLAHEYVESGQKTGHVVINIF